MKAKSIKKAMLNAMTSKETLHTPVLYVRFFEHSLTWFFFAH